MNLAPATIARVRTSASRWPAVFDVIQSATGVFLALFLWAHLLFDASILLGEEHFHAVSRFFEGQYLFAAPHPELVAVLVGFVLVTLIAHAALALRKFPANYRQYKNFLHHKQQMRHEDTSLWWVQVYTGFALLFLAPVHLYIMFTHPAEIGPYASADRVWSGLMWPLYLLLLLAVTVHAAVGLYRAALKWLSLPGRDLQVMRKNLNRLKWTLIVVFTVLGLLTLAAFIKLGMAHAERAGERYQPAAAQFEPGPIDTQLRPVTL